MGRPSVVTPKIAAELEAMLGLGVRQAVAARALDISVRTIGRYEPRSRVRLGKVVTKQRRAVWVDLHPDLARRSRSPDCRNRVGVPTRLPPEVSSATKGLYCAPSQEAPW